MENNNKTVVASNYNSQFEMVIVDELTTKDILNLPANKTAWTDADQNNQRFEIAAWGPGDNLPSYLQKLVFSDADAPNLLRDLRNFVLGQGLMPYTILHQKQADGTYKEIHGPVETKEVIDFLEDNEEMLDELFLKCAYDLYMFGNYFVNYLFNVRGQIKSVKHYEAHATRCIKMKAGEGEVQNYAIYISDANGYTHNAAVLPAYRNLNVRGNGFSYIFQGKDYTPGSPYYTLPSYIGAARNLELTSMVIDGQLAALKNGWNVKYIVSVHRNYYKGLATDAEKAEKRVDLTNQLNKHLSGVDKNNKALVVDMVGDYSAKNFNSLVKIEPVDNNKENAMQTKLLDSKNLQTPRAFGLDTDLAGIPLGGNLGSGTEILNKFNAHVLLRTPQPRKILLKVMKHIQKSHGWDKAIKWKFKDSVLTKLAENKSGAEAVK